MRREWLIFAIILGIVFSSSLSAGTDRLSVYVVNYPLKYFAERIAEEIRFAQSGDEDWANGLLFKDDMFLFVVVSRQTKNQFSATSAPLR